ncbi:NAD(P)/FAD-dependent oxidoreductase [Jatrophihabitans sp. DSM 45814]
MSDTRSVVVVGTGVGGLKVAEALRQLGFDGSLTLIGDEPGAPYDRPPLSKDVLKGTKPNPPYLLNDDEFTALNVTLLSGSAATALDSIKQQIELADGSQVPYDVLVVATGARARPWGLGDGLSNVFSLRTAADAALIAPLIAQRGHLALLGAGFIGCEVAASAREMGCSVTLIEMLPTPLAHIVGPEAGQQIARMHLQAGVDLRCETTIEDLESDGDRMVAMTLSDGTRIEADALVVGVGVNPNTEWLESGGLIVDNGIVCDAVGATSHANIYAIGDVARWVNVQTGRHNRVEHWTNASDHAAIVARHIAEGTHERKPLEEIPYFWSDQYGTKIQSIGEPSASADLTMLLSGAAGDRPLFLYSRGKRLTGVLGFGLARAVMRLRALIAEGAPIGQAVDVIRELHPQSQLTTID